MVPEKGAESLEWVKPGGPSDPGECPLMRLSYAK
jgi:hypothetical protein